MTDIGELVVRIKADAAQLERELAKANGSVKKSAGEMGQALSTLKSQFAAVLPALSVASVLAFGKAAFESADHINDLALRIGFAGSTLSALQTPLKQSGSNLDEFSASVNRMNNLIGEAAKRTSQEAVKAFDDLGLSVRKLQAMSPEQQFYEIAKALGEQTNQAEMTNAGMAIFGRSFAAIIPLIKESGGNIEVLVANLKDAGLALTDDKLRKIDEFGDRWTAAIEGIKMQATDALPALTLLVNTLSGIVGGYQDFTQMFNTAGRGIGNYVNTGSVKDPIVAGQSIGGSTDPNAIAAAMGSRQNTARGSNAGLLTSDSGKENQLKAYLADLQTETTAIGQNERALFVARAEIEATAKAKEDFNNKLRSTKDLTEQEKASVDRLSGAYYDMKKSQEEAARFQQELHDKLSSSLTDIAFSFDSAAASAKNFALAIAKAAFERKIASPIADALVGKNGSPGLLDTGLSRIGSLLGFADGGSPPVGVPSIVGERGPEIFVPNQAGTIVPNSAIGGSSVRVQQTIVLNPGATEQTVAQLQNLVPSIMAATQASVFSALQRGGNESRVAGLRS